MIEENVKEMFCRPAEERAIINYCMQNINNYFDVCTKLTPEDFLYNQHQLIMLMFESLMTKGAEKFEVNLIVAEATAAGILDNIGGLKYIQAISNIRVSKDNFNIYLGAVCEASIKYKLYRMLQDKVSVLEKNSKDGKSGVDLMSSVESGLMDLSVGGKYTSEPINLAEGLLDYIEERRENKVDLCGVSTGFPIFDKQIDGLTPGALHVIAARKKMGKSTFLSNIAGHIAYRQQIPVLYIDTELRFEEWRSRMLSIMSGVKERDIKHGGFDDETYSKLLRASKIIEKGKLFHEYMPGYSVEKLVALYKKYKHRENIGLIAFDYLKEPDLGSADRERKEYQLLGDIATKLKDLAGQLGIPALTACQLNRNNQEAGSDRVSWFADVVCHWGTRTEEEINEGGNDCGTHKLMIRDTRRGGATSEKGIGYFFFKEFLSIKEVAIDKQYFANFDKVVNEKTADEGKNYGFGAEELL